MRIVVVGAGGIGGWLGAHLGQAGHDVSFLVRRATLDALREGGLTVIRENGEVEARLVSPVASEDARELAAPGYADVVVLATKVGSVPALLPAVTTLTGPGTVILTTQNGLVAPEIVADAVGRERVLPGVVRVYTQVVRRGLILHTGGLGSLTTGEWDGGTSARVRALVEVLDGAGVRAWANEDIWVELWKKVAFVAPQGGLGAAVDAPIGGLRTTYRDAYAAMVAEVAAVAAAQGCPLDHDVVAEILAMADSQPAEATTSMQRDVATGLPSELDAQVMAVSRAGDEAGVPTPVFDVVGAVLAPREAAAREEAAARAGR